MGFLEDIDDLQRTQRLLSHGREGRAVIAALREPYATGDQAEDATLEFDLEVELDGAQAYVVTHRQAVPRIAMSVYVPGATVAVKVDPSDPHALVIQ